MPGLEINIISGWNLISLPFENKLAPRHVFGHDISKISSIYEYNNGSYSLIDLNSGLLDGTKGYWVLSSDNFTVTDDNFIIEKESYFNFVTSQEDISQLSQLPISNDFGELVSYSVEGHSVGVLSTVRYKYRYDLRKKDNFHDGFRINESTRNIDIINFNNIPLKTNGGQFASFSGNILDGAGTPTLLPNSSLTLAFNNCKILNSSYGNDIPSWNTSNVIDMSLCFLEANDFNQDIRGWDITSLVSSGAMFRGANTWLDNYINLEDKPSKNGPPSDWSKYQLLNNLATLDVKNRIYQFNGIPYDEDIKIGLKLGPINFFPLENALENHPIGFTSEDIKVNDEDSNSFELVGSKNVNGFPTPHYKQKTSNLLTFNVTNDFGTTSYHCYNHNYMGGQDRVIFIPE